MQIAAGVLVITGAVLFSACGGGGSPGATGTASTSVSGGSSGSSSGANGDNVTITNFMYSPMHLTVAPDATVTVTNKDSATHTLTATGGQFNTGNIAQNQTKTFTAPTKAGTYDYICNIHQFMMGTITVR